MANTHQNIQALGNGFNDTYANNFGGGGTPVARSELDFLRIGTGRQPSAEYPDGYLGTIRTRRDDRGRPGSTSENVLDSLKVRVTQRAYQRGVHRGERIDSSDYYYPEGLESSRGIRRQMQAAKTGSPSKRATVESNLAPAPHLPNDGKSNLKSTSPAEINETRANKMRGLTPGWK
jgi:hypothetical protein